MVKANGALQDKSVLIISIYSVNMFVYIYLVIYLWYNTCNRHLYMMKAMLLFKINVNRLSDNIYLCYHYVLCRYSFIYLAMYIYQCIYNVIYLLQVFVYGEGNGALQDKSELIIWSQHLKEKCLYFFYILKNK